MKFLEIRAMHEISFSRKASRFVKALEKGYKEKIRDITAEALHVLERL